MEILAIPGFLGEYLSMTKKIIGNNSVIVIRVTSVLEWIHRTAVDVSGTNCVRVSMSARSFLDIKLMTILTILYYIIVY